MKPECLVTLSGHILGGWWRLGEEDSPFCQFCFPSRGDYLNHMLKAIPYSGRKEVGEIRQAQTSNVRCKVIRDRLPWWSNG